MKNMPAAVLPAQKTRVQVAAKGLFARNEFFT